MRAFVISDLHLGNAQCRTGALLRFIAELPEHAVLVLNGDVMDRRRQRLPPEHQRVLDRLREEATRRRVVWVRGNHDRGYVMENPGAIEFVNAFAVERQLLVVHGHRFDTLKLYHKPILMVFRILHRLWTLLGGERIHVAHFAKRFPKLYQLLCGRVRRNAVAYAHARGFAAVACGHTHAAEDTRVDQVRYLNTGTWTEPHAHALDVEPGGMALRRLEAGGIG